MRHSEVTHPEVVAHEAVDDGIDEAIRHGKPVAAEEGCDVEVLLLVRIRRDGVAVEV